MEGKRDWLELTGKSDSFGDRLDAGDENGEWEGTTKRNIHRRLWQKPRLRRLDGICDE